jgi:hypothetical protein
MRIAVTMMALMMVVALGGCAASLSEEKAAIAQTLQNKYGSKEIVAVDPIVLRNEYAVADLVQGDIGARAVMQKRKGEWHVLVLTGQEARDAAYLLKIGVPQVEARALANLLVTSERQVPEERLVKLDRYAAVH